MFHAIILFFYGIIRKVFHISVAFYTALNRWMAFLAQLTMMFFIWNSLLLVIGLVSTVQMVIGFGFEVIRLTSPKSASALPASPQATSAAAPTSPKPRSAITEYWQSRRKAYQEMVDGLYVKYMNRLLGVQQQQAMYFQNQQYFQNPNQFYPSGGYYDDRWYGQVNVGTPEALIDDDLTVPTREELEAMTGTSGTSGPLAIGGVSGTQLQGSEEIMVGGE